MNLVFLSGAADCLPNESNDRRWFAVDTGTSKSRIRSSASDPFQGLRGHAYIQARGLAPKIGPMRSDAGADDCCCRACEQARLLPAVLAICESHERRKITDRPQPMWNNLADESLHELLDLPMVARM